MKKTYNKPFIMVELFQLDAALASSCSSADKVALHFTLSSCWSGDMPGADAGYFSGGSCDHDPTASGGDGNDTICYHGPVIDVATMYMNS